MSILNKKVCNDKSKKMLYAKFTITNQTWEIKYDSKG